MKVPPEIIFEVEAAMTGLVFGKVTLEVSVHDGKFRFRIIKEVSFIPGRSTSGEGGENDGG